MYEAILISSVLFFALGYFVGKMRAETKIMEKDIAELEKLTEHYDPIMKAIHSGLKDIKNAGLQ